MLRKLLQFLFGKRKTSYAALDNKSKKYLIDWVVVFMNHNRGRAYCNIPKSYHFKEFSKVAKENWNNILNSVFSPAVMSDKDIAIEQQIVSDIFNYYYRILFHEIRNVSHNIINTVFDTPALTGFLKDIGKLYIYLVKEHPKKYSDMHDIEKFGENVIFPELENVVRKILTKRLKNELSK
jgi:hypothetical protein